MFSKSNSKTNVYLGAFTTKESLESAFHDIDQLRGEYFHLLLENSLCQKTVLRREQHQNMVKTAMVKTFEKCQSIEEFETSDSVK